MQYMPKSHEEAVGYRYGQWAGNPRGERYDPCRCAAEVWSGPRGMTAKQCTRKNGKGPNGLYCGIHAKKVHA